MSSFEYKVVPAPTRGLKGKGIKGTQARFANALETVMNELGAEGWEYQRTDTLPVEERQGLTGKTTTFQNMLVFRRMVVADDDEVSVVAALIEDQSTDAAAETSVEETQAPEPEPEAQVTVESGAVVPTDANEDAVAQERVNETLEAEPVIFPWNRRANLPETPENADGPAPTDEAR